MTADDRSADALINAPAGQALLALADGLDLSPGDLADPLTAFRIATYAMDMINPWNAMTAARLERLAGETPARRPLAERLMRAEELVWWWAPLERSNQLWSSYSGSDHPATGFDRATGIPATGWEGYAHKPHPTILTSTATSAGISSLVIATTLGSSDLMPQTRDPIRRRRYTVRPDARVYEVTGPTAWAALARRYPSHFPAGRPHVDTQEEIVPDWPAVAHDWDAVHVSLGGLILATDVWVTAHAPGSRLWGWECEGTYWLRDAFDHSEPMPELAFDGVPDGFIRSDIHYNPALDAYFRPDLLMAGDGPAAVALRSSSAVSVFGPPRRES